MKLSTYFLLATCFFLKVQAAPHWPHIVEEILQDPKQHHLTPISGGASNVNYHLILDESHYFVRFAPKTTKTLYADFLTEYEVLKQIEDLEISSKPIYYDEEKRILITDFIQNDQKTINLLDPATRKKVIELLHKIENSKASISRTFHPYEDVLQLMEVHASPKEYFTCFLPRLKRIDAVLSKKPKKSLCHLDLHSKNILRDFDRFWIVDWEYATMSHPFLVLASMASIERWDDEQMEQLLNDYIASPSKEDWYRLYLYRIVADIFWTVWNEAQIHYSMIDSPYAIWGRLFLDAAKQRLHSPRFLEAMAYLENN